LPPSTLVATANDAWHLPDERCNFRDDDYDGRTDEGHNWVLGSWTAVYTGTGLRTIRAARMPNGSVGYVLSTGDAEGAQRLVAGICAKRYRIPSTRCV